MRLDVESLRTFLAVLDNGTMTRAAADLAVSQSAVSLRLRRLEERIGTVLLIRAGHSLRPSPTGAELLPYARSLVNIHDDAVARLTSSALRGTVRLGAGEERFAEQIAPVLGRFRHAHPRSTVLFHIGDRGRVLEQMLETGELDIVLTLIPESEVRGTDHVLWTDDLTWVVGDGAYIDAGHLPLVTFTQGSLTRQLAEEALRSAGRSYTTVFSGASLESVASAIRAGVGVALINRRSAPTGSIEWDQASQIPTPHGVSYVARLAPGDPSLLTIELRAEIHAELTEPRQHYI
jgi:DNA-binding transcriptional LysR family regulator